VKTKDDGKNAQNKQITEFFSFFLNFSLIFPKGTNRNQTFFIFSLFFIFFSEQGSQKMQSQKLAPTTEVGCGLQKNSTFSEKRAKVLIIFFLYFPDFFGNFDETKQGEAICC
jgi:hypothetical protein